MRKTKTPIPADGAFYACPLCLYNTTDKNTMIAHLVDTHGLKRNEAKALVEAKP